jgi:hypothetical protein
MTFTGNPKTFSDRVATSYGTEGELLEAWSDGLRGTQRPLPDVGTGRGGTAELLSAQPLLILLAAAMIARVEQAGA